MEVYYYTDAACPWSWALEPALHRLLVEFGGELSVTYVMAGMAKEFGEPARLVQESLEAAAFSGMPTDARVWLDRTSRSSYPACIAVKAVAEQADPGPFLRRLREGFMCRRRKLDTTDALLEEARATGGLDLERLQIDLGSHAILETFGADLERSGDATLPTLEFVTAAGETHRVSGRLGYGELRAAAVEAGAQPAPFRAPTVEDALGRFGSLATAEVAAVCDLPGPRAPAELWRLAMEWRVKPERLGSGELWSLG